MGDFLQGVLGDLRVWELESFQRDCTTQHHLAVRYAANRNLIGGSIFSCVDRLLYFVVMSELVTLSISLLRFNMLLLVMCREDLFESRRQSST